MYAADMAWRWFIVQQNIQELMYVSKFISSLMYIANCQLVHFMMHELRDLKVGQHWYFLWLENEQFPLLGFPEKISREV